MRLLLIDGSALAHRAFFGTQPLTRSDGLPVNATYGYCMMLWDLLYGSHFAAARPTHAVAIFDHPGKKTFRHVLVPDYKANRQMKTAELMFQLTSISEATLKFGVNVISVEGVEADDVIATFVQRYADTEKAKTENEIIIVSYDKDLMQLVSSNVSVYRMKTREMCGPAWVFNKWGIEPRLLGDLLALVGDAADNVPGVPSIGDKKAADLLNVFGNLEALLCNAETVRLKSVRENLIKFGHRARTARQVIELKRDVPIPFGLDDFAIRDPEMKPLLGFLSQMEFKQLRTMVIDKFGADVALA